MDYEGATEEQINAAINEILKPDAVYLPGIKWCDSWAFTGPLMTKHKISLGWDESSKVWDATGIAGIDHEDGPLERCLTYAEDGLRAVSVCFLMMNDVESKR